MSIMFCLLFFFEKFETRSTKPGTRTKCGESELKSEDKFEIHQPEAGKNTNVQNPKFKTKNMIQLPDSFGVNGGNFLVI
jgi:hypothetical protein